MGGDPTADRLTARATRLDAFAARLADELDAYVRREARALRDDYQRAGVSVSRDDAADELAYTVEIITIRPSEDGGGPRSVTLDMTAKVTESEAYQTCVETHRAAVADAAAFRQRATASDETTTDDESVAADDRPTADQPATTAQSTLAVEPTAEPESTPTPTAATDSVEARQTTIGDYLG